jgi:hypothetical protein
MMKLTFILLYFFVLTGCNSQIITPKNLNEAVLYFQQHWSKVELDRFKNIPETKALAELHFETGLWIRNTWIRNNKDTSLRNYFYTLGIYAPDDMSSIILTSLHRTLNKKDIQLDKQVKTYKEYWKAITDCDEKQKIQALSYFNKWNEGDKITIYMYVEITDGVRNAVIYDCPTVEKSFDEANDLILKGTITNKYFINDTANAFFKVRINDMNRKDTEISGDKVKIGDVRVFSLTGIKIE